MSACDEEQFDQWMSGDQISSFDSFCEKVDRFMSSVDSLWIVIRSDGFVNICIVDMSCVPQYVVVIKINDTMIIEAYRGNTLLSNSCLVWVLADECKLVCWSQLTLLLIHFASTTVAEVSMKSQTETVKQQLQDLIELTDDSDN